MSAATFWILTAGLVAMVLVLPPIVGLILSCRWFGRRLIPGRVFRTNMILFGSAVIGWMLFSGILAMFVFGLWGLG